MMNRSGIRASWTTSLLALLGLMLGQVVAPALAEPGNDPRAPELGECSRLKAPEGHKVAFHTYAEGVQIYRWDGAAWQFVAPDATLYADEGAEGEVGIHYGGPTWESNSRGKVVGAVVDRCTADPEAIPWLLLAAVRHEGPGTFARVTYIQRVNTTGGLPPAEPGEFPGDVARVPYTAEYYFYRSQR